MTKRVVVADADAVEATLLGRWIAEGGDEPVLLDAADNLLGLIAELRPDLMVLDIDFGGPFVGLLLGAVVKTLYGLSVTYVLPRRRITREDMARIPGSSILFRPVGRIPLRFWIALARKRDATR